MRDIKPQHSLYQIEAIYQFYEAEPITQAAASDVLCSVVLDEELKSIYKYLMDKKTNSAERRHRRTPSSLKVFYCYYSSAYEQKVLGFQDDFLGVVLRGSRFRNGLCAEDECCWLCCAATNLSDGAVTEE